VSNALKPSAWSVPRGSRLTAKAALSLLLAVAATVSAAPIDEPIQPIPLTLKQDPARADIGARLFRDPRLSGNGRVSCASCHDLKKGGADGLARSPGLNGAPTSVNTPSVLNAALNFRQFWDGRADSLEAQVDQVVQNPIEMGSAWSDVVRKVSQDPAYRSAFASAYRDGVTKANIQNAIATYERTLITPNSRFDRYLRGDLGALSAVEKAGYAKFKQYGCVACHQGVTVGGNMFQKFGVMAAYFDKRGSPTADDLGRIQVTRDDRDKNVFKVPSLRNVALTAPYFHDGSAKTLEAAVDVMFRFQLGRIASNEDKEAIVTFLHTLTGELVERP
jgi:cytochrome c peroxidase